MSETNESVKPKKESKSRQFLLEKRTGTFREVDREKIKELLKNESLSEGDLLVRATRVSEIRKSTKLTIQKKE